MLLEFKCSNHRSIRKQVVYSALATSDKSHFDNVVSEAGEQVLKCSVIYGANGSGKSNFIDAIAFVKQLVSESINYQPGQGILQVPHKLDGYGKESSYAIQFVVHDVRYAFGFTIKNMLINEEYLYYFPNGRQTKIYERKGEQIISGRNFSNRFRNCEDALKPNRLMLSCAANFSTVDVVQSAYRFFTDEVVIYSPANQNNWMNYSLHQINGNPKVKAVVLNIMKSLGTGIKDISVEINKEEIDVANLPPFLSDEFKKILLANKVDSISAKVIYDQFETDLMAEESSGIKKLFAILCPFVDVIVSGKVLICDELESNLHESLLFGLVQEFAKIESDAPAQLIFTTHETGLLNLDLFRRDQIWFTEIRTEDRSTDLFSLSEIRNVRKNENLGKGYISGKYGGIPMLNLDFANLINNIQEVK